MSADSPQIAARNRPIAARSGVDGRTARSRRMTGMVAAICRERGVEPLGSLRKVVLIKGLASALIRAEDLNAAVARGEPISSTEMARVMREIENYSKRLDRMRSWGQKQRDWRAEDNARASARSVRTASARSGNAPSSPEHLRVARGPSPPANVAGPTSDHHETERTET